ncbi:citrate synthase/methylcitrate synthase [Bacillus sp. 1P06AnD]|uniref:citrate synthase/methylcitrate synthase n=1 Tax=Bacillus sp. 1P06AnD TaxID=3132208 RepID=UPI0039A3A2F8
MFHRGLKGIVAAETAISFIDGKKGELIYRGYDMLTLAEGKSFEEVAYLLWTSHFPNNHELAWLKKELINSRNLPDYMVNMLKELPMDMDEMSVLRTVISASGTSWYAWKPNIEQAVKLTAMIPAIIAFRSRILDGVEPVLPNEEFGHVENYLFMLTGKAPDAVQVRALEMYMILTMEHGMNASTFAARVTASTESDLVSAITSAIGTMKGPLHGGAPSGVIDLLNEIYESGSAEAIISGKLERGERIMGFGHRVYKTVDPRARALKRVLTSYSGEDEWLDLAMETEEKAIEILKEAKPGRELYTNVEFYAAAIMKTLSMKSTLFTPTFSAARIVGWTAHVLEQSEDNALFRPEATYVGKKVK